MQAVAGAEARAVSVPGAAGRQDLFGWGEAVLLFLLDESVKRGPLSVTTKYWKGVTFKVQVLAINIGSGLCGSRSCSNSLWETGWLGSPLIPLSGCHVIARLCGGLATCHHPVDLTQSPSFGPWCVADSPTF